MRGHRRRRDQGEDDETAGEINEADARAILHLFEMQDAQGVEEMAGRMQTEDRDILQRFVANLGMADKNT